MLHLVFWKTWNTSIKTLTIYLSIISSTQSDIILNVESNLWGPILFILGRKLWHSRKGGQECRHVALRGRQTGEQEEALVSVRTANHLWGNTNRAQLLGVLPCTLHFCYPGPPVPTRPLPLVFNLSPGDCFPLSALLHQFCGSLSHRACESRQCPFTQESHGKVSDALFGWKSPEASGHCRCSFLRHGALFRFLIGKRKSHPASWGQLLFTTLEHICCFISASLPDSSSWFLFSVYSSGRR